MNGSGVRRNVIFSQDLVFEADNLSKELNVDFSKLVREALRQFIKEMKIKKIAKELEEEAVENSSFYRGLREEYRDSLSGDRRSWGCRSPRRAPCRSRIREPPQAPGRRPRQLLHPSKGLSPVWVCGEEDRRPPCESCLAGIHPCLSGPAETFPNHREGGSPAVSP